jgi:outer membrane protein assembly factor BamB
MRIVFRSSLVIALLILVSFPLAAQWFGPPKPTPTLFPTRLGLEAKWEQFESERVTPQKLSAIIAEDPDGAMLVGWGATRQTSVWAAMQRRVTSDPLALEALRDAGDGPAKALLANVETTAEIQPIARNYPWADAVHRAWVRAGDRELRRGHYGFAQRCFHDVLLWSGDAKLKNRAQVGLWLTLTHDPQKNAIEAAFQGADLEARYAWLGEELSAKEIRSRLFALETEPSSIELKDIETQELEVPGIAGCGQQPVACADGAVVAGPNLLAWYDKNSTKPIWTLVNSQKPSTELAAMLSPGPFLPALAKGRIFTRWGVRSVAKSQDNLRGQPFPIRPIPQPGRPAEVPEVKVLSDVVAFDARTGTPVWSTAGNVAWRDLSPVTDPTWSDGRIYVLALVNAEEYSPVFLICLDADSGAMLWKRELVRTHTIGNGVAQDVVHQGNAVTVADGFVYCLTNVGVVACCDARDGMIEWEQTYPQAMPALARQGSAPAVAGANVIFLPRDSTSVLAVERSSGEVKWLNADTGAQRIIGVVNGRAYLVDARNIDAIDTSSGKKRWSKLLPSSLDAGAALVGRFVCAGSRKKLYRINTEDGSIDDEQDVGGLGNPNGMIVQAHALIGTRQTGEARAPSEPDLGGLADKAARVIHRSDSTFRMNGSPADWEPHKTFKCEGSKVITERKVVVTHDDVNLYVGIAASQADKKLRPSRLDVSAVINKKPEHWAILMGPGGQATWEARGGAVPAGATARVQLDPLGESVTFTLSIPIEALYRDAPATATDRLGLHLALSFSEPDVAYPLIESSENLFLSHLTRKQETETLDVAEKFPELEASWKAIEEIWRGRLAAGATTADLYRAFIGANPKSPTVGYAMVRLDRHLRDTITSDPSGDVVRLAEQAGVAKEVCAWYRKLAGAYISQWVYIDTRFKTQKLGIALFDGKTWEHQLEAGKAPVPTSDVGGGVKILPGDRRKNPADSSEPEDLKLRRMTIPPAGSWQELRIPLIWLGMEDKPIHGIAFTQLGGSSNYWDRLVLVVDGKATELFGDDVGKNFPKGDWRWVDTPAREGHKVHTTPHPAFSDQTVRHELYFKEPIRLHVPEDPTESVRKPGERLKLIEEKLAGLRLATFGRALYEWAEPRLDSDATSRKKLREAILAAAADAEVVPWLQLFLREEYRNDDKPVAAIDALMTECKLKKSIIEEFRNRSASEFLRRWQVVGPFPNDDFHGGDVVFRPEEDPVDLQTKFDGAAGKIGWRLLESETDRVNLGAILKTEKPTVTYAVCWIQADAKERTPAVIEVGSQDGIKVWVNPRNSSSPVIDEPVEREAMPAQSVAKVTLQPSWNEIRIKVDSRSARSAFFCEIRDETRAKPLKGIQIQTTPPTEK